MKEPVWTPEEEADFEKYRAELHKPVEEESSFWRNFFAPWRCEFNWYGIDIFHGHDLPEA